MLTNRNAKGYLIGGVCLFLGVVSIGWADAAFADKQRQTIQNNNAEDANDLKLRLIDGIASKVSRVTIGGVEGAVDADGRGAQFAQGTISAAKNGGKLNVDWQGDKGFAVNSLTSKWTHDGNDIGPVKVVGKPMPLAFISQPGGSIEAFATFINPDPFPVTYSNIQLYRNNDLASFATDQFVTPTGELVSGLPSSIALNPGDSTTLSFGIIDASAYQLALAQVSETGTTDFFSVASAAVPEPSLILLVGVGLLALVLARPTRNLGRNRTLS